MLNRLKKLLSLLLIFFTYVSGLPLPHHELQENKCSYASNEYNSKDSKMVVGDFSIAHSVSVPINSPKNECSCSKHDSNNKVNNDTPNAFVGAIDKLTEAMNKLVQIQNSCGSCSKYHKDSVPNGYIPYKNELKQKEEISQRKYEAETEFLRKQKEDRLREAQEFGEKNKINRTKLQEKWESKAHDLPQDYSKSGRDTIKNTKVDASYPASHIKVANIK